MQRRKSAQQREDNDKVSQLIWSVRQRPVLYNYKLAPQERRRIDIAKGWQDVADELGGIYTADECRKKWKNIRDTYHQYRLRKTKYKDCLEKWRYHRDMMFLADIYQPKLKSKRSNYNAANNLVHKVDEVNATSIGSMIDVDESSGISFEKEAIEEETFIESYFDDEVDQVVDMDEVQFCDVDAVGEVHIEKQEDSYGEVCLYEEHGTNTVTVDTLGETEAEEDTKFHTLPTGAESPDDDRAKKVHLIIGNDKDELDLFFQFLKSKIQKLPPIDITTIQIEFLNAVLRKEAANALNS